MTVRNDPEGAFAVLGRALRMLGGRPDLEQRLHLLGRRLGLRPEEVQRLAIESAKAAAEESAGALMKAHDKKQKLRKLLKRLQP